jgi:hypothetical protein
MPIGHGRLRRLEADRKPIIAHSQKAYLDQAKSLKAHDETDDLKRLPDHGFFRAHDNQPAFISESYFPFQHAIHQFSPRQLIPSHDVLWL